MIKLRLLLWFTFGLMFGGYSAISSAALQWSAWSPGDPVTYCPSSFSSSGAGAYGWVYYDYYVVTTSSGETANCRAQCINSSLCGSQTGVIGGYGSSATRSASCTGSGEIYSNGTCTLPCQAGSASSATWWNGCFDVDGLDNGCDAGARLPYPSPGVCNGECVVAISSWSSCSVSVGGGPITCSGSGTLTGATCQSGDNYIPPSSQKCPTGYAIGTVNGVAGCYQTGSPSPATTTTTNTTGSGTTTTTTVKSDPNTNTKTTTTTTTNTTTGDQQTTVTISPVDPSQPMTGKENKAPGQDPLKIDESGTPTDGSLSAQKADYEAKANERKSLIDSMANQGSHGLTWDWTFQLPIGSCSPYTFMIASRSFTLDPCEKLGMVRDALGFLIYITTALALLSIATGYGREGK